MSARERPITSAPTTRTSEGACGPRGPSVRSPASDEERNASGATPIQNLSSASAGPRTAPNTGDTAPSKPNAARSSAQSADIPSGLNKTRCLCGKWWALRQSDCLVLKCKLCKRDIIIRGRDLRIEYR